MAEEVDAAGTSFNKKLPLRLPLSCDPPGPNNPAREKTWIVFGGTGHLGRSVVRTALAKGDLVTMVGRAQIDNIGEMQRAFSFARRAGPPRSPLSTAALSPFTTEPEPHPNLLCLQCDVRLRSSVSTALADHARHWGSGKLDVVANCSGYGVFGSCEDQDDAELRNQFETNFWGTLHIVQLTLPYFRANDGGRYLIFSSTSGALGVPGLGPYCATKYAVEGLVESMLYEIDTFNIRATLVSPGHVRRDEPQGVVSEGAHQDEDMDDFRTSGNAPVMPLALGTLPVYSSFVIKPPSRAYSSPTSPAFHAKRVVQWMADSQPTSVVKAAELVWQLAHCSYPPLRLLLGSFAVESVRDRLRTIMEEIEDWKFLSFGEEIDTEKARERILGREPSRENSEDEEDVTIQHLNMRTTRDRQDSLVDLGNAEDEDLSEDEVDEYFAMEEN